MLSITWAAAPAAAGALPAPAPDTAPGLEALRAGRFEEARSRFERITSAEPGAPEGPFFEAFRIWWQLLDRPEDADSGALRLFMEDRLREAVARAEILSRGTEPSSKERGLLYTGIALFLDAESKVARGAHFAAASSVRKGHRALTQTLQLNPSSADALFAMGTYNYFADHVSVLVKGLRLVLFIPGGDQREGLRQLEAAAARSRLFDTESLLLLSHIYAGNYEHDYRRALGYLQSAVTRHPDSPLLALIQAELQYRLGRLRDAEARAGAALAMLRGGQGYARDLMGLAHYRIAVCALALHDPIEALRRVEAQLETAPPEGASARRRWLFLLGASAREAGDPSRALRWTGPLGLTPDEIETLQRRLSPRGPAGLAAPRAEALRDLAAGRLDEAARKLETLLERYPKESALHYDLGRLLQSRGAMTEARIQLQMAVEGASGSEGNDIAGRALMRLAWDLERAGRRPEAIPLYRRAAALKGFAFRDAARDLADHPAENQPEG